ncbi:tubulin tyrosine ligase [Naegleria gruberi]|uniref:Tubulin tyrosine ligase n=1 Tax=Naegleria gruberi TaxID=5762 RepID=D2VE47_NAEGR|nr:tubulin tyrosine ligase [Naegleria gruberi]EFC44819.1 tubulin tyrosine ligase [Naegleria gruberi]|eukprot:XP_002677563.1 tubulin tyrosine ligase [Naegleria gruberi strain NEG-M]
MSCCSSTELHRDEEASKQHQPEGKFIHFSTVETVQGICWFYRSNGFCKHDDCPYQHIIPSNDDLYKKKSTTTLNNINSSTTSTTLVSSSSPSLESSSNNNNTTSFSSPISNNNKTYCWISMAKELKFAASVLRRTFEENGFNLLINKEDFAQFNKNNKSNLEDDNYRGLPLFWGHVFPRNNIVKWFELPSHTLINHFVNSHELCNKSLMALNFQDLSEKKVKSKSQYVPVSFYLPDQLNLFINHCENQEETEKSIWIVKPGRSGEGRGIQIYQSYQQVIVGEFPQIPTCEIESGIISEKSLKLGKHKMVVSKYIDNPLLIENKKFDMRMYVLLIGGGSQERFGSNTEEFHTYFYRDAIVRFASEDYTTDLDTLKNPFIHITNNSVNDKKNKIQNETITQKFGFFSNMYLPELIPCLEKMDIDWNQFATSLVGSKLNA